MTTDFSLKELSDKVYHQDPKHDKFNPVKVGDIKEYGDVKYKILKTAHIPTNGMQAIAVAPFQDGKVDTTEVVIAYAGTNSKDMKDILTDVQTIGLRQSELLVDTTELVNRVTVAQTLTAQKFADDIRKKYPNADITTTGHSLRQYLALYIAAENRWTNVGFNGPDPYGILSDKAKKWIKDNPGMLLNYRNKNDLIGNLMGNKTGAGIYIDMPNVLGAKASHELKSWKFVDGRLIISNTAYNKEARYIRAKKAMYKAAKKIKTLKAKLKSSGGKLTGNEKIFLDDYHASMAVDSALSLLGFGVSTLIETYKQAIEDAQNSWEEGIAKAQSVATELSYGEILSCLEEGGATKASIVTEPTDFYNGEIVKANNIKVEFVSTARAIKRSIDSLVQSDKDLEKQIEGLGI